MKKIALAALLGLSFAAQAAHHVLQVETINRLYRVNVELLQCSAGLPVVRPQRKSAHS